MYFIRALVVPILVGREIDLSMVKFMQTFIRPMVVFAALAACKTWLSSASHPIGWMVLVLMGVASGAIALVAVGTVGLTGDERKRFWDAGLKRVGWSNATC